MNVNLKRNVIYFLFLILLSCQNKEGESVLPDCIPSGINSSMTVTKTNVTCEDIDLLWEISFGVQFDVRAMSECLGVCDTNTIGYSYSLYKKSSEGIDTLNKMIRFYEKCGSSGGFTQTLNTELGDPQEYFLGDTIVYEIAEFSICPTPGLNSMECGYANFAPIEHPVIRDFYILNQSDFCN